MNKQELLFEDPDTAETFYKIIDKRIQMALKELKFNKCYSATVVAVGTSTADIKLQSGINTITGVPNKSGVTLAVNDEVYIEAINNSLNNIVIKYKK